ncbi:MAG TPA: elongation factor G [Kofleriaceae bacterium]|nr:elongation factor G [Kofleriaceae bacterium]
MAKIQDVRNIGIVAHIDAGKTTVTERFLYYAGKIHRHGEVHDGQAQMDWMDQERERGITITAAATLFEWGGKEIHLIDTPGHVDFTIEVERSLRVLDGAVVVFCAVGGVEPQSETVWHQADKFRVPRLAFINKMDRVGAEFQTVLEDVRKRLGANAVPIALPMGAEDRFEGVIDLVHQRAAFYTGNIDDKPRVEAIPEAYRDEAAAAREALIEAVADVDDVLAEKFLEGAEISTDELKAALRRVTIAVKLVPVLAGSALRNKGVHMVLDSVVDYLPAPSDLPPMRGVDPAHPETTLERAPKDGEPLAILAFKVAMDDGRKVVFLRIFSGTVKPGMEVLNVRTGTKEKVARLFALHANKRERIDRAGAGSIVAATGLKHATTGDTLCDPAKPILLERIDTYEPVISVAIEAETNAEKDKLDFALGKMVDEDPTFRVREDAETGQTLISGMGELHLEIIVDRLVREYKVTARVGKPQVVYRETVLATGEGSAVFERELKEEQLYGKASCKVSPRERGAGVTIASGLPAEPPLPQNVIDAGLQGLREAAQSGPDGYPLEDVHVVLTAIEFREEANPVVSVRAAAAEAFRRAVAKASPVRLEPIMDLEVVVPEEFLGAIIGDVNQRRGHVQDVASRGQKSAVVAKVALKNLFGYSTEVRSLTQGRASFSMQFGAYDTLEG